MSAHENIVDADNAIMDEDGALLRKGAKKQIIMWSDVMPGNKLIHFSKKVIDYTHN